MTYQEAILYMEQVQKKGSILGLEPIKVLLERLGNPQDKLSVIHVAGTNGKGSICTFLEGMYLAEGKRVGRYISPTIHCYLERFQVNGCYMQEGQFARLLTDVVCVLEALEVENQPLPTAFEIETAIAFLYFLEMNVDIVILETGMGGRLDATNVVSKPLCTVFASIGKDHMQFLGESIEQIAYEKAGIMKKDCPAVSYPNVPEVMQVLKDHFAQVQVGVKSSQMQDSGLHNYGLCGMTEPVQFLTYDKSDVTILSETLEGSTFCYKCEEYSIALAGRYQIYNAVTAIEVKLMLDGCLKKDSLHNVKWEGRFEKLSDSPLFIRDGAHNVDGVFALRESLQKHFTNYHIIFIIGVLGDKEYDSMMKLLCPMADTIFTITPPSERGLSGEQLKECVSQYCEDVHVCENVDLAMQSARNVYDTYAKMKEPAVIVAWGSLSYIGQLQLESERIDGTC